MLKSLLAPANAASSNASSAPSLSAPSSSETGSAAASSARSPGRLHRLLREPLLHFLVIGALIFAVDWAMRPPAKNDNVIVVTKELRESFIKNFSEDGDAVPTDDQMKKMIDAWVASEILYREGKKLGVDRGDETIRDRIAYKLQVLIFSQVQVPQPTDAELQAWFDKNHQQFDQPESVGFYLTPPADEETARKQLLEIETQHENANLQHQTRAILARPVVTLARSFGESFRDGLLALPMGKWSLLQSKDGWHVVRLDSHRPVEPASLDSVHDDAVRLWRTEQTRKQAWDAVNRLKADYTVRYEE